MRTAPVIAAALLLAACSTPAQTHTASTTSTTTAHSTADIAYLAAVRPQVQGSTDADLIRLGKDACTHLDGSTMLDVAGSLTRQGFTSGAAAAIVTAAIPAYCPQHKDMLTP
jgi:hypothetical protein